MSKVWTAQTGWTENGKKIEPEPKDMPGALVREDAFKRRLPKNWYLAVYGIPQGESGLRRRLCRVLKTHGLQSIDRGGSVYMGPVNAKMDVHVRNVVDKLRAKTGMSDLVTLFEGDYDQATAAVFLSKVVGRAMEEMGMEEAKIAELQRALAGEVKIVNEKGKEQNIVTTGYGRIDSAKKAIEEVDSLIIRFQGSASLEQEGERIRTRVEQLRAWLQKIEGGFTRYAAAERARQKASEVN